MVDVDNWWGMVVTSGRRPLLVAVVASNSGVYGIGANGESGNHNCQLQLHFSWSQTGQGVEALSVCYLAIIMAWKKIDRGPVRCRCNCLYTKGMPYT